MPGPAKLNNELMSSYLAGDQAAPDKLCLVNRAFIASCAGKVCRRYNCRHLEEDLISVGTLAFLKHLSVYDTASGTELTTFLYPHIMGAMRREVEASLGCMALPKRTFQHSRAAHALLQNGYNAETIAAELGVTEQAAMDLLRTPLYYDSLDALTEEGEDGTALQIAAPGLPVHREVYLKICVELMEEAFQCLSFREREILGGFCGVFGYEKQTLAELGEQFSIKENAALKAKDAALQKLTALCEEGKFGQWREVYRTVMRDAREASV